MFGRRKALLPGVPPLQPETDTDGKQPALAEGEAEFERRVKASLAKQDARRTQIEEDLLRTHGHNAIRPFFILSEPVFNSELGRWLVMVMNLMPYDDWNIVYLPMDRETQAAMNGLPLHPRQSIGPIDALMCEQVGTFYNQFKDAKRKVDQYVSEVGAAGAAHVIEQFVSYAGTMPRNILDHVARVRPMIIDLIADVQRKTA